jgi:CO/xanthine dehydrogenase FAD-binding subunit
MRSFVPDYELVAPRSLSDALSIFYSEPGVWKPFAGGTDLMVLLEAGKLEHKKFVSLWGLEELWGIKESAEAVTLGALTTYTDLLRSRVIRDEFPMLAQAARETGGVATQNRGTIGGNIVNASPAADSPPALLVYDAEVELMSAARSRSMQYSEFHTGYKTMLLEPGEILSRIRLPRRNGNAPTEYRKVGTRKAQAISKVCFAASLELEDRTVRRARFALGSVAPMPLRCRRTEAVIENQRLTPGTIAAARDQMEGEITPISDIRSTQEYRKRVAGNLLEQFLRSL